MPSHLRQQAVHGADRPRLAIFDQAIRKGSGLARRARFVMAHESGKIEVLAVDDSRIYMRYHLGKAAANRVKLLIYERNDDACWRDQLEPASPGVIT